MPSVDIAVPMHLRRIKQNSAQDSSVEKTAVQELKSLQYLKPQATVDEEQEEAEKQANTAPKKQVFNFVVMSKKNNKPQYHNMNVPLTSTFANQFRAREEVCQYFLLLIFSISAGHP